MSAVLVCSFRRLHVTPFTPELEPRIIAPSIKDQVKDISFHTVQTFPEKGYGFVELPEMEAEKLRKKFAGTTLKGQKVRIEEAKPRPTAKRKSEDEDEGGEKAKKVSKKANKGREEGVIPGHQIEEGRVVKRGWSEGDEGKKRGKRKLSRASEAEGATEGKRLRFKTVVPPNASPLEDEGSKKKKGKEGKKDKKVVVEEFGKSKKTLVTPGGDDAEHGELSYEDGKGWVNQAGEVVEAERKSKRPSRRKADQDAEPTAGAIESTENNGAAEDEDMAVDQTAPETNNPASEEATAGAGEATSEKEVHPLEALFKRPTSSGSNSNRPRPMTIDTSFSLFDQTAAEEDADQVGAIPPKTPNTKRDLEWRSIRSAAPTPDTAAIGRKFSFPFASGKLDEDEDSSDEEEGDAEMEGGQAEAGPSNPAQAQGEESAFRKWFYEHRGDFNRGWKKRRREEKKQKRQRENRRLSMRVT